MESFSACLNALQTMARCHLFLDEREVALQLVDTGLGKIEKAGVELAAVRARLAPKVNSSFPEQSWNQYYRIPQNLYLVAHRGPYQPAARYGRARNQSCRNHGEHACVTAQNVKENWRLAKRSIARPVPPQNQKILEVAGPIALAAAGIAFKLLRRK